MSIFNRIDRFSKRSNISNDSAQPIEEPNNSQPMDFIAIDFETANPNMTSPCSLGITLVRNNNIEKTFSFLINPEEPFSPFNIKIHGITAEAVMHSHTFPVVWNEVAPLFSQYPVIAHNVDFDKSVLEYTASKYSISLPEIQYYCTLQLCRDNINTDKYSLDCVCEYFDIPLVNHHCCDDDCIAAAKIMLQLLNNPSCSVYEHSRTKHGLQCISSKRENNFTSHFAALIATPDFEEAHVNYDSILDLSFDGKCFVLTGDFAGYTRQELSELILKLRR